MFPFDLFKKLTPEERLRKQIARDQTTYPVNGKADEGLKHILTVDAFRFSFDRYNDVWYDLESDIVAKIWVSNKWYGYLSRGTIFFPDGSLYEWDNSSPSVDNVMEYIEQADLDIWAINGISKDTTKALVKFCDNINNTIACKPKPYSQDMDDWLDYIILNCKFSCIDDGRYYFMNPKTDTWISLHPDGIWDAHTFFGLKKPNKTEWYKIDCRPNILKSIEFFSQYHKISLEKQLLEQEKKNSISKKQTRRIYRHGKRTRV